MKKETVYAQWVLVCVTITSQETVRACAPFVPTYCEKPHVVGFVPVDVGLTMNQCDALL